MENIQLLSEIHFTKCEIFKKVYMLPMNYIIMRLRSNGFTYVL